ncbi:MmgE/PrpD family protein [Limnohabitans sp. Rim8]|uniref:MmgE/PrpD family protein n=1 Tax=Limnohabitans sp. Rim8 TaxID=1100718 RepID=UPI0026001EA8|nr:MmgE/PrpD family protein [Limnohabitans sp. Rim8]
MSDTTPTPWSEWLVAALRRPVHGPDRERAALHLIDWLGCAHLGQTTELGAVLRQWAKAQAPGPVWVCGHPGLQATEAARWHGALGSCNELDDVHREAVVHPGDTVVPAAMAMAQRENASAEALLDALVVGYETAIVLGLLSGPSHYAHWYSTATTGVFASAMACARLLKLDTQKTQHALALAGMQSAGVWQCRLEPGWAKQMAAGHSAQAGLVAADMAAAGMTGPLSILEGPLGWLKATAGNLDALRAQAMLQTSAERAWRVHEVSFKPWPACRHVHPAIECALQLHNQGIDPDQIAQIRLETYGVALSFADQPHPQTALQGKFSLQHGVAWTLGHGGFGLEATAPAALADPLCAALRGRVTLVCGPAQDQAYPQSFGARLHLQMANGHHHNSEVVNVLGDPENPLSPDQVQAKAAQLLHASGWSVARAEQLIGLVQALPRAQALGPLWDSLQTWRQSQNVSSAQASASKRSS